MSGFFITVLNMSLTASYVVLIVLFIRLILGKLRAPKIFSYALWAVVLFRLIVPFSFESSFSLLPQHTEWIPSERVHSHNLSASKNVTMGDLTSQSSPQLEPDGQTVITPEHDRLTRNSGQGILWQIGVWVWLLGIAVLMVSSFISYFKLKRRLLFATRLKDHIFETSQIRTPFVFGWLKPKIYLPAGIAKNDLGFILLHEQTHIQRFDHWIKPAAFLVLIIHWFNPLIWIAYLVMIKDMEMSCDESVMKQSEDDVRVDYSNTLLSIATKQSGLLSPLAFGKGNMKTRIKNILSYKKPVFWVAVSLIIILSALALSLIANPSKKVTASNQFGHSEENVYELEKVVKLVEQFGDVIQETMETYTWDMALNNGDVVWSHKAIYRLDQLDAFIEKIRQSIQAEVRVVTTSKEGDILVMDLKYDGQMIHATTNDFLVHLLSSDHEEHPSRTMTATFSDIVIEERFSEHYNGIFTEYFLTDDENGHKRLILQIHPDLRK